MKKKAPSKARLRPGSPTLLGVPTRIKRHYARFRKLYNHPFGSKTSRYRGRAKTWLRSLRKGDEYYKCERCRDSAWTCDRNELRCKSCTDRHACCPRTSYFRKMLILEKLGLKEEEFEEIQDYLPKRRGRPASKRTPPLSEDGSEEESELESEEEVDQLEDDSQDEPVASSSRTVLVTPSSLPSTPTSPPQRSKRQPKTRARSTRTGNARIISRGPTQSGPQFSSTAPLVPVINSLSNLDHDERVLKELTSVLSRLERMDDRIKLGFATLLGRPTRRSDKEDGPPLDTPTAGSPGNQPGILRIRTPVISQPQEETHAYALPEDDNAASPITFESNHDSVVWDAFADTQHPGVEHNDIEHRRHTPIDDLPIITTINNSPES